MQEARENFNNSEDPHRNQRKYLINATKVGCYKKRNYKRARNNSQNLKIWNMEQTFKSIVERENSGNFQKGRNKSQRHGIKKYLREVEEQKQNLST